MWFGLVQEPRPALLLTPSFFFTSSLVALAQCHLLLAHSGKQRYTRIIPPLCFTKEGSQHTERARMSNQGNRIYVGNLDTRITERDLEVWLS